jgi:hypothetical protein
MRPPESRNWKSTKNSPKLKSVCANEIIRDTNVEMARNLFLTLFSWMHCLQGVTMTGMLAKACGVALTYHPLLNASKW